jgi:hypothetical protein
VQTDPEEACSHGPQGYVILSAQAEVSQLLASFEDFPPTQQPVEVDRNLVATNDRGDAPQHHLERRVLDAIRR